MAVIVDLTAPPAVYATRLLAEAGHRVVRVEPRQGDAVRRLGPFLGEEGGLELEQGAHHLFMNAGKQSFTPDLASSTGRDLLLELVERADAVVASAPLPVEEADLLGTQPRLVLTLVEDGDRPELCAYARSGLLSITGTPGQPPSVLGAHIVYAACGLYVAVATSAGLHAMRQSGAAQVARVSVSQCMESLMEQPMVGYLAAGTVAERRGYRGAITAVSGGFPCRDGYWMVSVPHGVEGWHRLVEWVQDPELSADPALAEERERLKKRDFILDRIGQWSRRHTRDELVAEAQRRHIPASPVATPLDLVQDPQLVARGFLRQMDHPLLGAGMFPVGAIATLTSACVDPAPRLGEHNATILAQLGYSQAERRALLEAGAV
jgi:crotonobetainyl-CoA:carnitine CoA-transferase CaiB-like acyl-CoA transferase